MTQSTELPFDGVLSGISVGLTGAGVALDVELTSQAGEAKRFIARLFPEDARRLAASLAKAATVAEMGEPATYTQQ